MRNLLASTSFPSPENKGRNPLKTKHQKTTESVAINQKKKNKKMLKWFTAEYYLKMVDKYYINLVDKHSKQAKNKRLRTDKEGNKAEKKTNLTRN